MGDLPCARGGPGGSYKKLPRRVKNMIVRSRRASAEQVPFSYRIGCRSANKKDPAVLPSLIL